MKTKRTLSMIVLLALSLLPSNLSHASGISMNGEFSEASHSAAPCDLIFSKTDYRVEFNLLESPRGAVIYFPELASDPPGFFNKKNIVGTRGYDDLLFEKIMSSDTTPGVSYHIEAEGFYSPEVIILDFLIAAFRGVDSLENPICTATTRFFARKA